MLQRRNVVDRQRMFSPDLIDVDVYVVVDVLNDFRRILFRGSFRRHRRGPSRSDVSPSRVRLSEVDSFLVVSEVGEAAELSEANRTNDGRRLGPDVFLSSGKIRLISFG